MIVPKLLVCSVRKPRDINYIVSDTVSDTRTRIPYLGRLVESDDDTERPLETHVIRIPSLQRTRVSLHGMPILSPQLGGELDR